MIQSCALPAEALLGKYFGDGSHTDCYRTDISIPVTHQQFVHAFYTTPLFKLESFILKWTVSKPSTDVDARQLADGLTETFAAWRVEARTENQLLMCDISGRTRSWLMVVPLETNATRLYFGSAVVPSVDSQTGKSTLGFVFHALLGFHSLYSRALLYAARLRLGKMKALNQLVI